MKIYRMRMLRFISEFLKESEEKGLRPSLWELFYTLETGGIYDLYGFGTPSSDMSADISDIKILLSEGFAEGIFNYNQLYSPMEDTGNYIDRRFKVQWDNLPYNIEIWMGRDPTIGAIRNICRDCSIPFFTGLNGMGDNISISRYFDMATKRSRGKKTKILTLLDFSPGKEAKLKRLRSFAEKAGIQNIVIEDMMVNKDQIDILSEYSVPRSNIRNLDYIKKYGRNIWRCEAIPQDIILNIVRNKIFENIDIDKFKKDLDLSKKMNARFALEKINVKKNLNKKYKIS